MSRQVPRSFSSVGTVSRRTLAIAAVLTSLGGVTAVFAARTSTDQNEANALGAAREILAAAEASRTTGAVSGCPTLSSLEDDGRIAARTRTDDAWGNRFRIVCDRSDIRIESAGPDQRFGTPDDVHVQSATD
jgi:general secretion pathway protein G